MRRSIITYLKWFCALGAAGVLMSCAPAAPGGAPPGDPPAAAAQDPVVYTCPGEDWGYPTPFTRYSRGPGYIRMSFLFDTLTWKDEHGVIPWLATEWNMSDDGRTWTFTLRGDVRWHDGEPFTAHDVAFSYQYVHDHADQIFWSGDLARFERAEALDAQTVRIHLSEPVAGPHFNVFGSVPIIPQHVWEDIDDPNRYLAPEATTGTGPFTLAHYSKEEGVYVYEANPDFWGGRLKVDTLVFPNVPDVAAALRAGVIDEGSFWGNEVQAVREFEDDPSYRIAAGPSFWVLQLIFNPERAPFDRVDVRRAVAHAVDRQALVDQVTHGGAVVANLGIVAPETAWANPELPDYAHDPALARTLLADAGAAGAEVTLIQAGYDREAELIRADLEAAGLRVTVQSGDRTTVDGLLQEGNFDIAISGHGGIANPSTLENPTWPAPTSANPTYDALFTAQAGELDTDARRDLIWQLQAMAADDLPVLTLYHPLMWVVYRADAAVVPFYTSEGIAGGIPIELNKLMFIER